MKETELEEKELLRERSRIIANAVAQGIAASMPYGTAHEEVIHSIIREAVLELRQLD